ncbi:hypothetical protein HC891_02525, partial [Candidatus Gracilibacteria bacterium]|nr:hypothetical protein [Candidatus Gracilibacteria bacterium]
GYTGSSLDRQPLGWRGAGDGGAFSATVADGRLQLSAPNGAYVRSVDTYTRRTLEGVVEFGSGAFQHVGFGSLDFAGNSYLLFSTFNTNNRLYARSNNNVSEVFSDLGPLPSGPQRYRIEWTTGSVGQDAVRYFLNGVVVATHEVPSAPSLHVYQSYNSGSAPALMVDALAVYGPYAASGSYTTCALDAGAGQVFTQVAWTASVPTETGLSMQARSSADGVSWSGWATLASSGAPLAQAARYVEVQASLTSSDSARTPLLDALTLSYASASSPTTTPTVASSPSATPTNTALPTETATHSAVPTATATNTALPTATATNTALPLGPAVRINVGGSDQLVGDIAWSNCEARTTCDNYRLNGTNYSTTSAITLASNSAPANEAVYQIGAQNNISNAGASLDFRVPVTNGNYEVRLHFAETQYTAANRRRFDIRLEGIIVEGSFDTFAQAGGRFRAIVRSYNAVVNDGRLDLSLVNRTAVARISGIEIIRLVAPPIGTPQPTVSPTPTAVNPPTASAVAIRVNGGGSLLTDGGITWQACTALNVCDLYNLNGANYSTSQAITLSAQSSPATATIYQTGRYTGVMNAGSTLDFRFLVPDGTYTLRLHFAETSQTAVGRRRFDIEAETTLLDTNVDVFQRAGGRYQALVTEYTVTVNDGELNLSFINRVNQATVAGIEIIGQ